MCSNVNGDYNVSVFFFKLHIPLVEHTDWKHEGSLRRQTRFLCQAWGRARAGEGSDVAESRAGRTQVNWEPPVQQEWVAMEQSCLSTVGWLNWNSKRLGDERGNEEGRETDWLAIKPELLLKVFLPQQAAVSFKAIMKLSWNSTQNSLGLYYTFLKNTECSVHSRNVLVHALLQCGWLNPLTTVCPQSLPKA